MSSSDISENHRITRESIHAIIDTHVISRKDEEAETGFFTANDSGWIFDFRKAFLQPQYLDIFARFFWDEMGHLYPFQVGGLEMGVIPFISAIGLE